MSLKAFLTPEERLRVAHAHFILGIDQQHLAVIFNVNIGRINEACRAIAEAMRVPKAHYEVGGKQLLAELGLITPDQG